MAQEFEPVFVRAAGQEFRGAASDSFGALAPREPPVVEEEPQEFQIPFSELPPQEEVLAEAAVEVLDEGTGAWRFGKDLTYGGRDLV